MKKLLAILLAAIMLLSLAACGENTDNPSGNENTPGTSQSEGQGGTENQGGEDAKEWNENNWQEFLAENFGLSNVSNPGGTVGVVRNASGQIKHIIFDDMPESFNYEEYVGQIWDICVGAAKDGSPQLSARSRGRDKSREIACNARACGGISCPSAAPDPPSGIRSRGSRGLSGCGSALRTERSGSLRRGRSDP